MLSIRDLLATSASPVDIYSDLVAPRHVPLLISLIGVMLAGSTVLIAFVLASPAEEHWRLVPAIAVGLLGLLVLWTYHWRGSIPAIRLLILGGWTLATVTSFFGEGVRSPILMTHSVILIFAGWVLGTRF